MMMNRKKLLEILDREGIRRDAISLEGGLPDDRLVLDFSEGGWTVYYSERGEKWGQRLFDTEAQACAYILDELLADPSTRKNYGRDP